MRIAMLHDTLGRSAGGVEAWMYHAAQALRESGLEVRLAAPRPEALPDDTAPPEVETVWLEPVVGGSTLLRPRRRLRSYSLQLRRRCADVDAFISRSAVLAEAAGRIAAGRPVVFVHANAIGAFCRASLAGAQQPARLVQRLIGRMKILRASRRERRAMHCSDALIYLSRSRMQATLQGRYAKLAGKAFVVPPGVDLERFSPQADQVPASGPLGLLSVCRLSPEKNLPLVADAVYLLKREGIRVSWQIAGQGSQEPQLREQIQRLGIGDRVEMLGRVGDVENLYRRANLFVLPSTYEGFGHVYLEALASGLPCIALSGRSTGLEVASDEIIGQDRTGFLLSRNEPEALAEILRELTRDRSPLVRWSRQARSDAEARFRWSLSIKRLLAAAKIHPERKPSTWQLKKAS